MWKKQHIYFHRQCMCALSHFYYYSLVFVRRKQRNKILLMRACTRIYKIKSQLFYLLLILSKLKALVVLSCIIISKDSF